MYPNIYTYMYMHRPNILKWIILVWSIKKSKKLPLRPRLSVLLAVLLFRTLTPIVYGIMVIPQTVLRAVTPLTFVSVQSCNSVRVRCVVMVHVITWCTFQLNGMGYSMRKVVDFRPENFFKKDGNKECLWAWRYKVSTTKLWLLVIKTVYIYIEIFTFH